MSNGDCAYSSSPRCRDQMPPPRKQVHERIRPAKGSQTRAFRGPAARGGASFVKAKNCMQCIIYFVEREFSILLFRPMPRSDGHPPPTTAPRTRSPRKRQPNQAVSGPAAQAVRNDGTFGVACLTTRLCEERSVAACLRSANTARVSQVKTQASQATVAHRRGTLATRRAPRHATAISPRDDRRAVWK